MYYKELFVKGKKKNDFLKGILLAFSIASLVIGIVASSIFLIALCKNGYKISISEGFCLEVTSKIGTSFAGIVGTLVSLSSIFFVVLTLYIQQKEINESRMAQKDTVILEAFYKALDCIDVSVLEKEDCSVALKKEFAKFSLITLRVYIKNMFETIDLFLKTMPLVDKMIYLKEPLSREKMESVKSIYDKANLDSNKLQLLSKTNLLNTTIINALQLVDSLSESLQGYCIILLKTKLGNHGNMLLLMFAFLNQVSWNVFGFYTLDEIINYHSLLKGTLGKDFERRVVELTRGM